VGDSIISGEDAMRMPLRFPVLAILCASGLTLAGAQHTRATGDTAKTQATRDSLIRRQDSTRTVTMTVDSSSAKLGTSTRRAEKPRSSTIRTIERQTAPHAAKNAPNVRDTKPTTK
jgi:hypothetical protein